MQRVAFAFALLLTTSAALAAGHPVHSLPKNKEAFSAGGHTTGNGLTSLHRGGNSLAASQKGGDRVGNGFRVLS